MPLKIYFSEKHNTILHITYNPNVPDIIIVDKPNINYGLKKYYLEIDPEAFFEFFELYFKDVQYNDPGYMKSLKYFSQIKSTFNNSIEKRINDCLLKISKNDNGKIKLFETGELVDKKDCIYINNIGWFTKNDPRLTIDYISKEYIIIDKNIYPFYIIGTEVDDYGIFINNRYTFRNIIISEIPVTNNVCKALVKTLSKYDLIPETLNIFLENNVYELENFKNNYVEDLYTGNFIHKKLFKNFVKKNKIKGVDFKLKHEYSFFNKIKNKPLTTIKTFGKEYSFGLEIETISGILPERLTKNIAFESVHDGSLRDHDDNKTYGKEYVTDVLQGDLGLLEIKKLLFEIKKRCLIDKRCSVHYHLGEINFTKENTILMYYLYSIIQEEIFSLLPISRHNNIYCKKLKPLFSYSDIQKLCSDERNFSILMYYNILITLLSSKSSASYIINKLKNHPQGHKCGYNHNSERYCWVNFIPAVFNTRENQVYTIEFRALNGTNNYTDIKNFLMICMALVSIVEDHKSYIYNTKDFLLEDILKLVYPKNYRHLVEWINIRKYKFNNASFLNDNKKIIAEDEYLKEVNFEKNENLEDLKLMNL